MMTKQQKKQQKKQKYKEYKATHPQECKVKRSKQEKRLDIKETALEQCEALSGTITGATIEVTAMSPYSLHIRFQAHGETIAHYYPSTRRLFFGMTPLRRDKEEFASVDEAYHHVFGPVSEMDRRATLHYT